MSKSPLWFKVVAVVALLWNLIGCLAFASDIRLTPEDIAKLPDAQQALYNSRPSWAVAGTAVAVIAGALGSLALLLGKKWALPVLIASLIGIVVQDCAMFILADGAALAGTTAVVLQALVLLIAIALVLLSRKGIARSWLK
ncbi:hypothetical protein INQ41_12995 [Lysobacter ciconiae]|uniref:Sugar transporter n=1 Tax=Novilysobacter ciconiae TaxID=2781022 RepID=A0A7S6ZS63_9GAMM|nr:hypothetical protein [Lysobacter ciconiae]QOW19502.1 hypothetical protein INQ41_12995 [Lysobacter ciconiae]